MMNLSLVHLATDNYATPQCPLTSISQLTLWDRNRLFLSLLRLILEHFCRLTYDVTGQIPLSVEEMVFTERESYFSSKNTSPPAADRGSVCVIGE